MRRSLVALFITLALAPACFAEQPIGEKGPNGWLTIDASVAARIMYDSNVMLESTGPQKNIASPVTVITPSIGFNWHNVAGSTAKLRLDYTNTDWFYHSRPDENNFDHLFGLKLSDSFKVDGGKLAYDLTNSFLMIDGESESFCQFGDDGAAALGAPSIRDRRDQLVFKGGYKLQYTSADNQWFVRPLATVWFQDFRIRQQNMVGYCNFADRAEYAVGGDLGWRLYDTTDNGTSPLYGVVGYRAGWQYQGHILNSPQRSSNQFQRVLVGLEGKVTSWLKMSFLVGPDFRNFVDEAPPSLDGSRVRWYAEGSLTATLSPSDEIIFTARHWTIPASGGKTVYDDSCYDLALKHIFDKQWTGTIGLRVAGGEWEAPSHRDDWVFSPRAVLEYKLDQHWSFEGGYQFDAARSADRNLDGRDYARHLAWIGVKWSW